jgi:LysM repeat protein
MNYSSCNGIVYVIKPGDTLYQISLRYGIPLALILRANPYVDIHKLQVGDKLCIPVGGGVFTTEEELTYTVGENQTIQDILDEYDMALNDFLALNPLNTLYLRTGTVLKLPD